MDGPLRIRVASLNVHGFQTARGQPNVQGVIDILQQQNIDVVGLQEIDLTDSVSIVARASGLQYMHKVCRDFLGNAILSRYPLSDLFRAQLEVPGDHGRTVVEAQVNIPGFPLRFVCTHLCHREEGIRLKQWDLFCQRRSAAEPSQSYKLRPALLVGDFNSMRRTDYTDNEWLQITERREHARIEPPRADVMRGVLGGRAGSEWKTDLYSSARRHPDAVQLKGPLATCPYFTRIDFILANKPMAEMLYSAHHPPAESAAKVEPLIRLVEFEHLENDVTDHAMVIATFMLCLSSPVLME